MVTEKEIEFFKKLELSSDLDRISDQLSNYLPEPNTPDYQKLQNIEKQNPSQNFSDFESSTLGLVGMVSHYVESLEDFNPSTSSSTFDPKISYKKASLQGTLANQLPDLLPHLIKNLEGLVELESLDAAIKSPYQKIIEKLKSANTFVQDFKKKVAAEMSASNTNNFNP